ncbi:19465_t:CDS:2, partial [Racocetra fulgida]
MSEIKSNDMSFEFNETETNINMSFEVELTTVELTDHISFVITENSPTDSVYSTSETPVELCNPLDRKCCAKNMLQEVDLNAVAISDNMLFEINEKASTDSSCSTFETPVVRRNRLARKRYAKKMIQDTNLLAVGNSESAYEHKRRLQREAYAQPKRRKINCYTSKNAYMELYDSRIVALYDLGKMNIE